VNSQPTTQVQPANAAVSENEPTAEPLAEQLMAEPLVEEALVEEVSIDGMCGVY
jgi:mycofactocin precursor